jgi:16S rRNA processing protein RimM
MPDTKNAFDLVPIGFIRAAHGLNGAVLVHAWSGKDDSLTAYGPLQDATGENTFTVKVNGPKDKDFICRIKGIDTRNAAEALRGIKLFIAADKLPPTDEDEYYHRDLVGLAVENADGQTIGRIADVVTFGHGDALLINFTHVEPAQSELLLFTKQNVPYVSIAEKRVVVELPDGLFAEAEK